MAVCAVAWVCWTAGCVWGSEAIDSVRGRADVLDACALVSCVCLCAAGAAAGCAGT